LRRPRAAAVLAGALLLAPACAHVEAPPGGQVEQRPPQLVSVQPDTAAVVPGFRDRVVIEFDVPISEQGLDEAVTVSPRTSPAAVDRSGGRVRVSLRRGWEAGRIYHVEVGAGVRDRFGNRLEAPVRLVFSTGPAIPATRATGTVTDRITGQPVAEARVEAILQPDSLVYVVRTDTAGRFEVARVPEGDYLVRAFLDQNRSRALDATEPRDTARLAIRADTVPALRLVLLPGDTTPPVAGTAAFADGWVEVRFDDYLDPDQPLAPAQVTLAGPEGAVAMAEIRIGQPPRDTTAADTADAREAPQPAARTGARPADAGRPGAAAAAPADPLPSRSLFARPAQPLLPDTIYTVTVTGVRNVNGLVGGGEAPLRTPRPAPAPEDAPAPDEGRPAPDEDRPEPDDDGPEPPPPPDLPAPGPPASGSPTAAPLPDSS
jgi:hypothetical protein